MTETNTYEAYKATKISWLPRIPKHWSLRKNKYIFSEINDRSETGNEELLSLSKYHGLIPRSQLGMDKQILADSLIGYKTCQKRDMVLNKLQAWNGILDISKYHGLVSPDYSVFRIKIDISERFLFYLFRTSLYISEFRRNSSGVGEGFFRLYSPEFFNISSIVPPLSEQKAIAEFLDYKTAQIDTAITKKQQLIELLHEQKQAIINKAVTQGLNGNVEFKNSETVWLGNIPKHWDVNKLKFLSRIKTGEKNTEDKEEEGMYPFFVRSDNVESISTFSFDGEAVLTAGDGAGVAKVFHYINGKFDYHQRVYKMSNFKKILGPFFYFYIKANFEKEVLALSAKTTVDSIRLPMLKNFPVTIPPLCEQAEIVAHIETENQKINTTVSRIEQEIELLKEYRTTLIASAVTGKINVLEKAYALQD